MEITAEIRMIRRYRSSVRLIKKNDIVDGCVIYCLGNMRSRRRDISEQNEGLELVVIQETGVGAI